MLTNKERIEPLEAGLGIVQDDIHHMEVGIADKFQHLEKTITHHSNILLNNRESTTPHQEDNFESRQMVSSKTAKLEFPRFAGDDPTKWFRHVNQFFDFQNTPNTESCLNFL